MKITKQARAALFVMLAVISILPGCGKNKNQDVGVVGVGVAVPAPVIPGYNGALPTGCTASYGLTSGFVGVNTQYTGIAAYNMAPTGIQPLPTTPGVRINKFCDRVDVSTSGTNAIANVYLGPNATQIIQGSGGTVCGLDLSGTILSQPFYGSEWQGTFGGGVIRLKICSPYGSQTILL